MLELCGSIFGQRVIGKLEFQGPFLDSFFQRMNQTFILLHGRIRLNQIAAGIGKGLEKIHIALTISTRFVGKGNHSNEGATLGVGKGNSQKMANLGVPVWCPVM